MIFHYQDTPIYYESHGQGPALVLLHGFLESSTMWKPFIPKLSQSHTLISLDLPGHGRSGCIAEVHTMELMADVLHALLSQVSVTSFTLIGHSMGGYVGLAYAETHGQNIDAMVLLNSTTLADSEERKHNRDRALVALMENRELFLGMAISNLFSKENRKRYSEEIKRLKQEALQFPLAGIKAALLGMKERKDRTQIFTELDAKKVIVGGTKDNLIPISTSKALAVSTKSIHHSVAGGHMSHIEAFHEIVKIVHFIE